MESTRQQKIAKQIQKDIADIFQKEAASIVRGVLVTVTTVRVSPDFGYAKIYVSVFPSEKAEAVMGVLEENAKTLRGELGNKVGKQLRIVPEIIFYLDSSLDYVQHIEELLKK